MPRWRRLLALLDEARRLAPGGAGGDAFTRRRASLLGFTSATIVLGLTLLVLTTVTNELWPAIDPGIATSTVLAGPTGGLLLWLLYGLAGSLRVLRVPGGGVVTFHLPFVGAAMILGGPTAGAWVAFLSTVERRELETQPWYGILANHAVIVIAAVLGAVTTRMVALAMPGAGGAATLAAATAGAVVMSLVSTGLGAMTVLLREDISVRSLAEKLVRDLGRITAIECALAVVLALAFIEVGWWAPIVVAGFVLVVWDNDPMPDPDRLTGLQTVVGFGRLLDGAVGRLRRHVLTGGTVLSIDLDLFKAVNDSWGHGVGNEVLAEVGNRLRAVARRPEDIAGRLGGDEFAVFLAGLTDVDTAIRRAEDVVEALRRPIATSKGTAWIGASIGVVVVEAWGGVPSADTLLDHADDAMFHAKHAGGGVHLYDPAEPSSITAPRSKPED